MLSPASHIILVAAERAFWKTISPNKGFAARLWRTVAFSRVHTITQTPTFAFSLVLMAFLKAMIALSIKIKWERTNERKKERKNEDQRMRGEQEGEIRKK